MHDYYEIEIDHQRFRCCVGRSGIISAEEKREGDGATPAGCYKFRQLFYRPDRINLSELQTDLPITALQKNIDGWCDDPESDCYNKHIRLPFNASHEDLWLEGHTYDIILVIGYNDDPVKKNKGSAIFLHITNENYHSTAGCIAVLKNDLLKIVCLLTRDSTINITLSSLIQINACKPELRFLK